MFKNETTIGYSLALLDIAKDEKKLKEIYEQSNLIVSNLEKEEQFIDIMDSPNITTKEKDDIINKTFKGFHWSLTNVMKMLSFENRFRHLNGILKNLIKNLQEILNIKNGIVYSPKLLSKNEILKLEQKLQLEYKSSIKLTNHIDNELIGGFKVVLGSIVIEDSIKSELELIKKALKEKGGV